MTPAVRRTGRSRALGLAVLLPLALSLAGCGGSGHAQAEVVVKDPAALAPGACRSAAPLLNDVHRDVARLRSDPSTAGGLRAGLASAQTSLAALPSPRPAMTELGTALGVLRLGIDTHSYGPATLDRVDAAVAGAVEACRPA